MNEEPQPAPTATSASAEETVEVQAEQAERQAWLDLLFTIDDRLLEEEAGYGHGV